jgi:hypothetical protein
VLRIARYSSRPPADPDSRQLTVIQPSRLHEAVEGSDAAVLRRRPSPQRCETLDRQRIECRDWYPSANTSWTESILVLGSVSVGNSLSLHQPTTGSNCRLVGSAAMAALRTGSSGAWRHPRRRRGRLQPHDEHRRRGNFVRLMALRTDLFDPRLRSLATYHQVDGRRSPLRVPKRSLGCQVCSGNPACLMDWNSLLPEDQRIELRMG